MTGMLISHRTRSREWLRSVPNASAPLLASKTSASSMPACRRQRSTILRITEESSTISARILLIPWFHRQGRVRALQVGGLHREVFQGLRNPLCLDNDIAGRAAVRSREREAAQD